MATATRERQALVQPANARRLRAVHYLALAGLASAAYGGWTIIAWLADGPRQVVEFRDTTSLSWKMARVYEGIAILAALCMLFYLIRDCRRNRRLTFDATLSIAWAAVYWTDPLLNSVQPVFFYSSNWVNLENWCGHMPGIRNADCGRLPEPVLFVWLGYAFLLPIVAIGVTRLVRALRQRWPTLSPAKLIGLVCVALVIFDIVLEKPIIGLHLWAYPGSPDALALGGRAAKLPLNAMIAMILAVGDSAALRLFKDDKGRTIVERGLERHGPRTAVLVRLLATYGVVTILLVAGAVITIGFGFYSDPYPRMPAHLVNNMCDSPGITGTPYGPCPGSTSGWNIPIRKLNGAPR